MTAWLGRLVDRSVILIAGPEDRGVRTSVRVGVLACVLSLLHGSQPPESLSSPDTMNWQEQHLLAPSPLPAHTHGAKLAFRLVPPALGRVLHLDRPGYFVLLVLAGVVMFTLVHRVIADHTSNARYATLCCVALAFCYLGQAFVADLNIFFDGLAIVLAVGAVVASGAPLAALLAILSLFTDERALITLVLGVLAMGVITGRLRFRGVAAGVFAYGLARAGLQVFTELSTHTEGVGPAITADLGWRAPVGVFAAWSATWLLVVRGLGDVRSRPWGMWLVAGFAVASAAAVLVYDVTRSAAYAFPAVLAAMVTLFRTRPAVADTTAVAAVLIGGAIPAMTVIEVFYWNFPLPYHVLRVFLT